MNKNYKNMRNNVLIFSYCKLKIQLSYKILIIIIIKLLMKMILNTWRQLLYKANISKYTAQ